MHRRIDKEALSNRERDTLVAIAKGMTSRQVASELGITHSTAETYIKRLYIRLGVSGRALAALEAQRRGLV